MPSPVLKIAGGLTAIYVAAALVIPVTAYYNATQTDWVPDIKDSTIKTCVNDSLKEETRELARLSAERAFFEATTLGMYKEEKEPALFDTMPVKIALSRIVCRSQS